MLNIKKCGEMCWKINWTAYKLYQIGYSNDMLCFDDIKSKTKIKFSKSVGFRIILLYKSLNFVVLFYIFLIIKTKIYAFFMLLLSLGAAHLSTLFP